MAREIVVHEAYLVQINSDIRITVLYSGRRSTALFLATGHRDGYAHGFGYIGNDRLVLLTHAQYVQVNSTADNNWQVVRNGGDTIVPLLDLIEGLDRPTSVL